ncbi:putative phenazine-modifying enzyme [Xenorhabdus vietnamensis]|uniref:asparagine synthase (glutamine-hydrolyzing) n=1 Tax=Xenorhabdus vietnamensis TaxID=351656 RepID=A0A1Y2SI31_9GAMM|nr:asparagine synthase (glutamine-hydrolyzing) [Xenorhabdus vietnamensis]OTA17668.1 putative phenazine-modifying enzyme [Xenorhabdus vietnamensis]
MCGIAGFLDISNNNKREEILDRMIKSIRLRGPDDEGCFIDGPIALGHRRLSIIDIKGGSQPMNSALNKNFTIIYNGEIYNYKELRNDLIKKGMVFQTNSDTEVILQEWIHRGKESIKELNGIFAFAIWDSSSKTLHLVRDRLGVKPLYYYINSKGVIFGSEIKTILSHPDVKQEICEQGVTKLLLPLHKAPGETPYTGIYEVIPGNILSFKINNGEVVKTQNQYWNLLQGFHSMSFSSTVELVRDVLLDTVNKQIISDVPLGSLLSGGLDSTAISAIAQKSLKNQLHTYEVDFLFKNEDGQEIANRTEDSVYAQIAAKSLGTKHHKYLLTYQDLTRKSLREESVKARDLPNGIGDLDLSLLSLFHSIKPTATVVLSGEASDEIMGGYRWFHNLAAVESGTFPWLADTPAHGRLHQRILNVFRSDIIKSLDVDGYLKRDYDNALIEFTGSSSNKLGKEEHMQFISYLALTRFLPTLLERKDRLSMSAGVEARVPFCDHRLIELVFSTPWLHKSNKGIEKVLLKSAVDRFIPSEIINRRKIPYPSTLDPKYSTEVRKQLGSILEQNNHRLGELFDLKKLDESVLADEAGSFISNSSAELALNFDCWYNLYGENVNVTV